ncbi:hypothetical protein A2U01_0114315, partial [Trifolium medium]|nr:hypothetical protein [Trifolium medium]
HGGVTHITACFSGIRRSFSGAWCLQRSSTLHTDSLIHQSCVIGC